MLSTNQYVSASNTVDEAAQAVQALFQFLVSCLCFELLLPRNYGVIVQPCMQGLSDEQAVQSKLKRQVSPFESHFQLHVRTVAKFLVFLQNSSCSAIGLNQPLRSIQEPDSQSILDLTCIQPRNSAVQMQHAQMASYVTSVMHRQM